MRVGHSLPVYTGFLTCRYLKRIKATAPPGKRAGNDGPSPTTQASADVTRGSRARRDTEGVSPCVLRGRGHWAQGADRRGTGQAPVLQNSGARATVSSLGACGSATPVPAGHSLCSSAKVDNRCQDSPAPLETAESLVRVPGDDDTASRWPAAAPRQRRVDPPGTRSPARGARAPAVGRHRSRGVSQSRRSG